MGPQVAPHPGGNGPGPAPPQPEDEHVSSYIYLSQFIQTIALSLQYCFHCQVGPAIDPPAPPPGGNGPGPGPPQHEDEDVSRYIYFSQFIQTIALSLQ